jgi:Activator of Hsp90 ATPase homolog 1-like protein
MERSSIQRIARGFALTACLAWGAASPIEAVSGVAANPPEEATGEIVARNGYTAVEAELPAGPERVFRALISHDVVIWWARPNVFDTKSWQGEARVGGHWKSGGSFRDQPYETEGDFILVDSPRLLVQTWNRSPEERLGVMR